MTVTLTVGALVEQLQKMDQAAEVWTIETCECCTDVTPMAATHVVAAGDGCVLIPADVPDPDLPNCPDRWVGLIKARRKKEESAVVVDGFKYDIDLKVDGDRLVATSQDFPEVTTFGVDVADALGYAKNAVEEAIAARIHDGRPLPK